MTQLLQIVLPILLALGGAIAAFFYTKGRGDKRRDIETKTEQKANDVLTKGADARAGADRRDGNVVELRKSDGFKRPD